MSPAAFEELFVRHERSLRAVVRRWLRDPEDAAEIVQDAFARVWKVHETLRSNTAAAYLYRTALHLAVSRMRRHHVRSALQHRVEEDAVAVSGPPEDALLDRERAAAVRAALDELPEDLRRVVELRDVTELSYAEIAGILAIKEGTVGSRRHAALARLRAALVVSLAAGVLAAMLLRPTEQSRPADDLLRGVDHPALVGWDRGRPVATNVAEVPSTTAGVRMYRFTGS